MRKSLFIAAMAAMTLASCSENKSIETDAPGAIQFGSFVGQSTKAATPLNTGTFGVFGYYTGEDAFSAAATPNFMFNQKVEYTTAWTYSPIKYWPNNDGEKVSFIAYRPHTVGGEANYQLTWEGGFSNTSTGLPTAKFVVESTAATQTDLMFSKLIENQVKTENAIKFNFGHALTQVNFDAKLAAELAETFTSVVIDEVTISGTYNTGTLDLAKFRTATDPATVWNTTGQTAVPFIVTLKDEADVTFKKADAMTAKPINDGACYLLPQNLPADAKITIKYRVITTDANLGSGNSTISNVKEVAISGADANAKVWNINQRIKYTLTISLTEVTVDAEEEEWLPEEGEDEVIPDTEV